MSRPFLLLQTGSAPDRVRRRRGDYPDWFRRAMRLPRAALVVADARTAAPLPDPRGHAGVVVTGSDAMVSHREPWGEAAAHWLRGAVEGGAFVFGVCYGHQLLGHALGGQVDDNPRGEELGTTWVERLPAAAHDPLFTALPQRFRAQSAHRQSVLQPPPGALPLARSDREPLQAMRIGERAWGVQFHPEFSAGAMRGFLDPGAPRAVAAPAPQAARLLRRFVALVRGAR
ncbi:MAG: glutamine amidotransferase [Xanthomonadaceae bacterium]|jgi:GMP synthase (glutamine-hydrolysing)|nr:glutamine amidotransferase [Xanthomonadaceae bacterium]